MGYLSCRIFISYKHSPVFEDHYWLRTFLLTFNELLLPIWFFQGIEKMKYITIVNLSARLLFVVTIFLFVYDREDYLIVPLLNGIGAMLAGCLSLYIVLKKGDLVTPLIALLLLPHAQEMEMTGSTIAFPWAVPVFKYGVAFCTAVALGQLLYYFLFGQYRSSGNDSLPGTILCMAAAGLVGYFVAAIRN